MAGVLDGAAILPRGGGACAGFLKLLMALRRLSRLRVTGAWLRSVRWFFDVGVLSVCARVFYGNARREFDGCRCSESYGRDLKDVSTQASLFRTLRMGNSTSATTDLSNVATAKQIQETILDNCVVIFSKTTCSYCNMAKKLFGDMNVTYKAIELDTYENGNQFQDVLHRMTGGRTVPRIFINGSFVGGATDTQKLHKEGKLLPLVHQCQMQRSGNSEQSCSFP